MMAKADKTRRAGIAAAVTMLAENFNRQVTEHTFEAYFVGLEGLSVPQIEAGVSRALRECSFMPPAAELRKLAGELTGADRAVKAWGAFEAAVMEHGGYRTVDFDDVVINATVRNLGGWEFVCDMSVREFENFLREKFLKAYVSFYMAGVGEEEAAPLRGTFDRENARHGHQPQQVQVIVTGLPPSPRAPRIAGSNLPRIEGAQ
jgi:hypothetical protein